MKTRHLLVLVPAVSAVLSACASMGGGGVAGGSAVAIDSGQLLSIDHFVRVKSTAPAMNGQFAQVYVRERVVARNPDRRPG